MLEPPGDGDKLSINIRGVLTVLCAMCSGRAMYAEHAVCVMQGLAYTRRHLLEPFT